MKKLDFIKFNPMDNTLPQDAFGVNPNGQVTKGMPKTCKVTITFHLANPPTPAPGPSLSQQIWNILLEPDQTTEWKHDEIKKLFTLRNLLRKWQSDLKSVFQRLKLSKKNLSKKQG